jgi:4-O-beta-D-mannosyl-D-glucose phosphorylase
MARFDFEKTLRRKIDQHLELIERKNRRLKDGNGVVDRWQNPVLTAAHAPVFWRYDLDPERNPMLLERLGVNAAFNVGAIEWQGKICLMARVEGSDRKSFFAVAESDSGVDGFRFRDHPVVMPEVDAAETNVYDMRLTAHEDGWVYGVFWPTRTAGSTASSASSARTRPRPRVTPRPPSPRRGSPGRGTSSRGRGCPTSSRSPPSSGTPSCTPSS